VRQQQGAGRLDGRALVVLDTLTGHVMLYFGFGTVCEVLVCVLLVPVLQ
jgi:hypothetical protein